ncbi:hypothetical protein MTBGP_11140 [Moorella thermoacetica]|uniref:DUF2283 domain-containing protein n=1 Tax=Neomoorella thermoacetica TaxID=1525 RepID=UPI0030CEB5F2
MIPVRITNKQVKYDQDHDILHVFFYPEELSVDDEDYPGIVIRRSIKDDRVTGIMIMDYSRRSKDLLRTVLPRYDFKEIYL